METRRLRQREGNVEFRATALKSREDHKNEQALHVVTLRLVKVGEKLFVNYDIKYWLEYPSTRDVYRNKSK